MFEALALHWPEYLIEAALLSCFLFSACVCATLLEHPRSAGRQRIGNPVARRFLMGLAMGLTAVGLIYSPWGQRSGAHLNPAITLTFLVLGKVAACDALFYILAQVAGAVAGVAFSRMILGSLVKHASVSHVVTVPGSYGVSVAWLAELVISFAMMIVVLYLGNDAFLNAYTGVIAGMLVALFILVEAPLSGMSMNPARSFGSAFVAGYWRAFWIYLTAPLAGMLLAASVYMALPTHNHVFCAKLDHCPGQPCIFRCEFDQLTNRQPLGGDHQSNR